MNTRHEEEPPPSITQGRRNRVSNEIETIKEHEEERDKTEVEEERGSPIVFSGTYEPPPLPSLQWERNVFTGQQTSPLPIYNRIASDFRESA